MAEFKRILLILKWRLKAHRSMYRGIAQYAQAMEKRWDLVSVPELEGMEVRNPAGKALGTVCAVLETPAHVLLEIKALKSPLIPFTREHVPEVNLEEGWLTTTYPLGEQEVVE